MNREAISGNPNMADQFVSVRSVFVILSLLSCIDEKAGRTIGLIIYDRKVFGISARPLARE